MTDPRKELRRIEALMLAEVFMEVGDDIARAIDLGEIKAAKEVLVEYLRLLRTRLEVRDGE